LSSFEFFFCFGYGLCLYKQNDDFMQFLLSLVILEDMGDEFEYDQASLNLESLNLG